MNENFNEGQLVKIIGKSVGESYNSWIDRGNPDLAKIESKHVTMSGQNCYIIMGCFFQDNDLVSGLDWYANHMTNKMQDRIWHDTLKGSEVCATIPHKWEKKYVCGVDLAIDERVEAPCWVDEDGNYHTVENNETKFMKINKKALLTPEAKILLEAGFIDEDNNPTYRYQEAQEEALTELVKDTVLAKAKAVIAEREAKLKAKKARK